MKYPIQKKGRLFRKRKVRKNLIRKPANPRIAVPSFFTLMNLFCGFLSIISVSQGNFSFGAWLIVFAGLFDALDGLMARLANATSEFGMELDSLSDVVSFGVAPGFLIYNLGLADLQNVGVIIAALPPLCGAVRLARFNVNARFNAQNDEFIGLPIPAQAIILCSLYLTYVQNMEFFDGLSNGLNTILIPVVISISFLMVSPVPFDKIPRFDAASIKRNKAKVIIFVSYLLIILVLQEYGLMIVLFLYILKGLLTGGSRFWKQAFLDEEEGESGTDFQ
jgi:CDP-diacylglycerol--serine O-phosphatidyltransferase